MIPSFEHFRSCFTIILAICSCKVCIFDHKKILILWSSSIERTTLVDSILYSHLLLLLGTVPSAYAIRRWTLLQTPRHSNCSWYRVAKSLKVLKKKPTNAEKRETNLQMGTRKRRIGNPPKESRLSFPYMSIPLITESYFDGKKYWPIFLKLYVTLRKNICQTNAGSTISLNDHREWNSQQRNAMRTFESCQISFNEMFFFKQRYE